jgi:hypothetical protein
MIDRDQGELLGIPPTGKRIRWSGISICRVAEGKVAEQFERWDRLDLMQQLGVIPARGPGQGRRVYAEPGTQGT